MRAIGTPKTLLLVLALAAAALSSHASAKPPTTDSPRRPSSAPAIRDVYGRVAANNLDLVLTNLGSFGYRLYTGGPGLTYPKGSTNSALFAGGIWIGAKGAGVVRHAAAEYLSEFTPGTAPDGAATPDDPRFRTYTIVRGDTTSADYLAWPVQDGAPTDLLGRPEVLGDVHVWSVYNDVNDRSFEPAGTLPLQVEVRQSTFAYAGSPGDSNTIFLRFRIRNTGVAPLDSAYVGLWLDPDLGDSGDDLIGCDTTLALGYCYNATNLDAQYGSSPPSIGIALLQGPTFVASGSASQDTLGMSAFYGYQLGEDPTVPQERYLIMRGVRPDGREIHEYDEPLSPVTPFRYSGDPVTSSGWLDQVGSDRRLLLSAGPFSIAPGSSQEIVAALIVGQGTDRLSSITDLRARTAAARALASAGFPASGAPAPTLVAPAGVEGFLEEPVEFFVRLLGDDANAWSITMDQGPAGASFQDLGGNVGRFAWTPALDQQGVSTVTFSATGAGFDTRRTSTDLVISRRNHPPTIAPIPDFVAYLDQTTEQPFEATDPDGDDLNVYDCSPTVWSERSVVVTESTPGHIAGVVRVSPSRGPGDSVADVSSRLCVWDPFGETATLSFKILVRNAPEPPRLSVPESPIGRVGRDFSIGASLFDHNVSDSLNLDVSGYPSSLHVERTYSRTTANTSVFAMLSGVPRPEDVGTFTIIWRGSDGLSPEVVDTTRLEILPRPSAPAPPPPLTSAFVTFPTDGEATAMAPGDFNRDGKVDVATVSSIGLVSVLLARSAMEFTLPFDQKIPGRPLAMAGGDWNQDGATDLVVVRDSSAVLQILLSRGDGSFDLADADAGVALPVSVAADDFDHDGFLDLAVGASGEAGVVFLRGDGSGGFTRAAFVGTVATPLSIVLSDWNRDGIQDMAVALPAANKISVYLGPLLGAPPPATTVTTVNFPRYLSAGDFTNDGVPDLALVGHGFLFRSGGTVVIFRGRGDGSFESGAATFLPDDPASAVAGDFDGDGRRDLAVGFAYSDAIPFNPYEFHAPRLLFQDPGVTILFGRGDGTLDPRSDIANITTAASLGALDLDGDGRDDLLAISRPYPWGHSSLQIFPGRPSSAVQGGPGISTTESLSGLALADLDADGAADVAATSGTRVLIWMNSGKASFGSPSILDSSGSVNLNSIATGDFNGDGFADLALSTKSPPSLLAVAGRAAGAPNSAGQVAMPDTIGGDGRVSEIFSASPTDLDHDGYDDLAVLVSLARGTSDSFGIVLFRGSASGLGYVSGLSTGVDASGCVTTLEPASNALLIVDSGTLLLWKHGISHGGSLTDCDGNVIPPARLFSWDAALHPLGVQELSLSSGPNTSIVLGDFDGDGSQDLAMGNALHPGLSEGINLLSGQTGGSFGPRLALQGTRPLGSLVARDFNGDGISDLAALDPNDPSVVMSFGHLGGMPATESSVGYGLPASARILAAGDLNGDGAPDVAASCPGASQIAFLFNQTDVAPIGILERSDASVDRVLLEWRTLAAAGSAASVVRFDAASGASRTAAATVETDGRVLFEDTDVSPGTMYLYRLRVRRAGSDALTAVVHVDVPAAPPAPAAPLHLAPAAPNPIRETTSIAWTLPAPGKVSLRVFDVQGRAVATLLDDFTSAGAHSLRWTGRDQDGKRLASGVYWVRLETPDGARTRKIVVAR